jgi:hypothetical protein
MDNFVFDVDEAESYVIATVRNYGSDKMALDGQFDVDIYMSDCHIGNSDTIVLASCDVTNTTAGEITGILGLLTANVEVGSVKLTDFVADANYAMHIETGGAFSGSAPVDANAIVLVTGIYQSTLITTVTSEVVSASGTITTSANASDTITMTLDLAVTGISFTVEGLPCYLDLDVHLEGTSHMSPDPALGGLIALGLGGAGTWLRRRRV